MLHPVPLDPVALPVPLLGRLVPAGFPSPADDYLDGEIDLSRYLIERPVATFLMRIAGESMRGAGILDGDLVMVDRSVEAQPGRPKEAFCSVGGERGGVGFRKPYQPDVPDRWY